MVVGRRDVGDLGHPDAIGQPQVAARAQPEPAPSSATNWSVPAGINVPIANSTVRHTKLAICARVICWPAPYPSAEIPAVMRAWAR